MRQLQRLPSNTITMGSSSRHFFMPFICRSSPGVRSLGTTPRSIIKRRHPWYDQSQRRLSSVALLKNTKCLSKNNDSNINASFSGIFETKRRRSRVVPFLGLRALMTSKTREALTVAIIGSGPAGLSAALHLAPLVEEGIIQGPIHLYESIDELGAPSVSSSSTDSTILDHPDGNHVLDSEVGHYEVTQGTGTTGRDVGVGIWSTALTPFHEGDIGKEGETKEVRHSHRILLNCIHDAGTYVDKVGYRTPDGSFLARSQLCTFPITPQSFLYTSANDTANNQQQEPGLVFLPENKLMEAFHKAVDYEVGKQKTVLKIQQTVELIICDDLPTNSSRGRRRGGGGRLVFVDGSQSDEKYSLILAAGGTHSILRKRYSRHMDHTYKLKFGISLNPNRPDGSKEGGCKRVAPVALSKKNTNKFLNELSSLPLTEDMEDRGYVVFRGNAPIPLQTDHHAFQTWGTHHALRFATVPCKIPIVTQEEQGESDNKAPSVRPGKNDLQEGQVWFFTTNDDKLLSSIINQDDDDDTTKGEWKRKLVNYVKAQNWHNPVAQLIEATPSSQMWMESALAHQYAAAALGGGFEQHYERDEESGEVMFHHVQSDEPLLVYVGDADMTVDPVLAQGITVAMEDASDVAKCVRDASRQVTAKVQEQSAVVYEGEVIKLTDRDGIEKSMHQVQYETLRMALKNRHDEKMGRLVCLLRATELVQTLAQPNSSLTGLMLKTIFRPLMRYGAPQSMKRTIFDWMLKYSLGWFQKKV